MNHLPKRGRRSCGKRSQPVRVAQRKFKRSPGAVNDIQLGLATNSRLGGDTHGRSG